MTRLVTTDVCWLEVYEDGAVGPDFGWPDQGDKFANLGPSPRAGTSWPRVLADWLDTADCSGEAVLPRDDETGEPPAEPSELAAAGPPGEWTRAYLEADDVCAFLDAVFGPDEPGACALKGRLNARHRYIAFAMKRTWLDDPGEDPDEPEDPFDGEPGPSGKRVLEPQR